MNFIVEVLEHSCNILVSKEGLPDPNPFWKIMLPCDAFNLFHSSLPEKEGNTLI